MKAKFIFALATLSIFSCKNAEGEKKEAQSEEIAQVMDAELYGEDFKNLKTLSSAEMGDIYKNLKPGDTINATFKGHVQSVCQNKGCWMQVDVGADDPVMIKFKDYGFFVPKDIAEKEVVVHGQAFITEVPVEEQQHLALDGGRTEEEIEAITSAKKTLSFTATGVKINP
ncbi:MAG: DUF4920 domain-containing protein [Cytophagaceae bacterium]|nr:DUF4920 domain-containing protein [Cytophagaceae bacterium]|tara:strand:- start:915 stop:1424 length:510 start_codon:yes stop_codon:yes gene_type:complete